MPRAWSKLRHLLQEGLADGVYSAAAAAVGRYGELQWQGAVGTLSTLPEAPAVTSDTLFDLASLTKPLATAMALMLLVSRGHLRLTTTLGDLLPADWLPSDKRSLTLAGLLAHRAGLPAWRPFYPRVLAAPPAERPTLLPRLAAATPLQYPPDTATVYSDLGFMLLKAVIEQATAADLDRFCRRELYQPLGLATLGFNPKQQPHAAALSIAATETGHILGRDCQGEVHDENAWAAGGVAGHAGLFGTAGEVFTLIAALYNAHQGLAAGPWAPEVVRLFLTPVVAGGRALGFDTPGPDPAQRAAGRFFSPHSVGHLGFTGTSFWLDLDSGWLVVLLTNRVHLGRHNDKIKAFRPRFHDAAAQILD